MKRLFRKNIRNREDFDTFSNELPGKMLEEYRVSVFAPELGTSFPVSAKRLKKHVEKLEVII